MKFVSYAKSRLQGSLETVKERSLSNSKMSQYQEKVRRGVEGVSLVDKMRFSPTNVPIVRFEENIQQNRIN